MVIFHTGGADIDNSGGETPDRGGTADIGYKSKATAVGATA